MLRYQIRSKKWRRLDMPSKNLQSHIGYTENSSKAIEAEVTAAVSRHMIDTVPDCSETLVFDAIPGLPGTERWTFDIMRPDGTTLTDFDGVVIPTDHNGKALGLVAIVEAKHSLRLSHIRTKVSAWREFEKILVKMRKRKLRAKDFSTNDAGFFMATLEPNTKSSTLLAGRTFQSSLLVR
ncbi:hypothetical protein M427DRAFT_399091 [Gonapodya prolifera JEL478]|uniref:Uncharacterized protein n=1 Tax=Gonapodya prolifera (strain JEL478) TaxID=1344416 RepID=A0A139A693_GONPJ|nr:hypothetical protein M427DRAFT_399091 [Gonapodya prolifera JEL478]|eukprot:KXS12340.1 hypothetical protein M427DRAFT_399091 [Gonapodya prolifera JEL478]